MTSSLMLAQAFGIIFTVGGISVATNPAWYRRVMAAVLDNAGLQLLAAFLPLIAGAFMVTWHNIWETGPSVVVTIFGWLFLIGGVFRTCFIDTWLKMGKAVTTKIPFTLLGAVMALIGLSLLYLGFAG